MSNLLTFTRKTFDPLNPDPTLIDILDIAYGLSNECRFGGQCEFYCVAQHSVLVAEVLNVVAKDYVYEGLMHDATEAYLKDIPHPLKYSPEFAMYLPMEERLGQAIFDKFNLTWPLDKEVKWADTALLLLEEVHIRHRTLDDIRSTWSTWKRGDIEEYLSIFDILGPIKSLTPTTARKLFLNYWNSRPIYVRTKQVRQNHAHILS